MAQNNVNMIQGELDDANADVTRLEGELATANSAGHRAGRSA